MRSRRSCAALSSRTDRNFEVVVADDGSGPATAALVQRWQPRLGVPLTHVWQVGLGLSGGRNPQSGDPRRPRRLLRVSRRRLYCAAGLRRGAPAAGGAGLVRDRQPRAAFCRAHRGGAARWLAAAGVGACPNGWVSAGAAGSIGYHRGAAAAARPAARGTAREIGWARAPAISPVWHSGSRPYRWLRRELQRLGAEEDSDLLVRLIRAAFGARMVVSDGTGVIHLWHPEEDRAQLSANQARLDTVLLQRPRARPGRPVSSDQPRARSQGWCRGRVAGLAFARRPIPPAPA